LRQSYPDIMMMKMMTLPTVALSNINPDRVAGMVFGSFIADALALGPHWIYDQGELERSFGQITDYIAPKLDSYHPKKAAGDQSHYGDQATVLMESICDEKLFNFSDFAARWKTMWNGYPDYVDHATKDTLARLESGLPATSAGSHSEELGGAARIAPLLAWMVMHQPLDAAVATARQQTSLTHTSPIALDAAEFITRTVYAILENVGIPSALEMAAKEGSYAALPAVEMLEKARASLSQELLSSLKHLGLACPAAQSLPATMALLLRFPEDIESAFKANAQAGGDSAARALVLGMIAGAQHGLKAIPERWFHGLNKAGQIEAFLDRLED